MGFIKDLIVNFLANIIASKFVLTILIIAGLLLFFLFSADPKTIKSISSFTGLDITGFLKYIRGLFTFGSKAKESINGFFQFIYFV